MHFFRHTQNSGIFSFLFFSGMFQHIQSYLALLRHIHTYWDIKAYSDLFRHIQQPVYSWHIHNLAIFWAMAYLEQETYLKPCVTLTRHIQNLVQGLHMQKPGILGILEYLELFHKCIPMHIQDPFIFIKIYEYSELWHI